MEHPLYIILGMLVPMALLIGYLFVQRFKRDHSNIRSPVSEKMLRPAGESLRLKLEDLNDEYMGWMATALWMGGITPIFFASRATSGLIAILVVVEILVVWKAVALLNRHRDCLLGFNGERLVAQELTPLIAEGCHIFHDFPAEKLGNIDHIIVAPTGVYAVETKARRKRNAPEGRESHKIIFDGQALHFPQGNYDTRAMEQAQRNAAWLSTYLTKATGESVPVTPILTYPGWYIELKGKPEFPIVATKMIHSTVTRGPETLDPKKRQQIAFQIEQKVRDVEF